LDDLTLEKVRLDSARVLMSTSSLEVINTTANVMVDDVIFEFKIVEERGLSFGEDACLSDETGVGDGDNPDMAEVCEDDTGGGDVDALVNQITDEWVNDVRENEGVHGSKRVQKASQVFGISDSDHLQSISKHKIG
jgi:hypothetical protein